MLKKITSFCWLLLLFFSSCYYENQALKGNKSFKKKFAKEIKEILSHDGVWHFEQSYMPSMLRTNSYDTICHEHLECYSLQAISRIMTKAGLKIIDVIMNNVNGGSFAVSATHEESKK